MSLDSFFYLGALLGCSFVYYLCSSARQQNLWLMLLSFLFYYYLTGYWSIVLVITMVITIFCVRLSRSTISILGIVLIILQFILLKDFIPDHAVLTDSKILFPLGISFFTFQAISLIIDCRHRPQKDLPRIADILLYLGYFPQLTAGPIEKGDELIPQFQERRTFSPTMLEAGLVRIGTGFLKKFLIANALAEIIFKLKGASELSIPYLLLLPILCRYFIYSNFSAYTDIALGSSQLFHIKLTENFRSPLQSKNLTEFWQRWHMTLGRFVKSYIYFPLALNLMRKGWPVMLATLASFILIGLWHGLTLNFLIYGIFQALFIILESRFPSLSFEAGQSFCKRYLLGSAYRYLVFMLPSVLFFFELGDLAIGEGKAHIESWTLMSPLFFILLWELAPIVAKKGRPWGKRLLTSPRGPIRLLVYLVAITILILFGQHQMAGSFLYFYF